MRCKRRWWQILIMRDPVAGTTDEGAMVEVLKYITLSIWRNQYRLQIRLNIVQPVETEVTAKQCLIISRIAAF